MGERESVGDREALGVALEEVLLQLLAEDSRLTEGERETVGEIEALWEMVGEALLLLLGAVERDTEGEPVLDRVGLEHEVVETDTETVRLAVTD